MSDIIERYDAAEQAGRARLSNRAIQAFQLDVFATVGYPFRVSRRDELWRYHDVMQEGRFEKNLRLLGHCTPEERDLLSQAAQDLAEFSSQSWGVRLSGRHCLTRALLQLRLVKSTTRKIDAPVVEIGPGSGYLALLLARSGFHVITIEASQAFACYQTVLFRALLGSHFTSFEEWEHDSDQFKSPGISQLPWWTFADQSRSPVLANAVTANHVLAEMNRSALTYYLVRFGHDHARMYGFTPTLIAESLGSAVRRSWRETVEAARMSGWTSRHKTPIGEFEFQFDPAQAAADAPSRIERIAHRLNENPLLTTTTRAIRNWRHSRHRVPQGPVREEDASISELRELFETIAPAETTPDHEFQLRFGKFG